MERTGQPGLLTDHTGKRSSSRAVSFISGVTLCGIAVGQVSGYAVGELSESLLMILAGLAIGPLALNRWLGEGWSANSILNASAKNKE